VSRAAWIDKQKLMSALVALLEQDLAKLAEAQRNTQSGATHEESKPENDKDTRALESSYLARGQAKRVAELQGELERLKTMECLRFGDDSPIALSAVVELESSEGSVIYWLVPAGAGSKLEVDGQSVRVVTPQSPLGRSLLRKQHGDGFEVQTPQGLREYEITRVC
jgi:transcription elongation GreA/GreB family factor